MLSASVILAFLALVMSFPISLGTSFLITSIAPARLRLFLMHAVRMMTGVPTVVYSFAALFLLVPLMRNILGHGSGLGLLTAAPVLGLLIAPTMIIFFVNTFNMVDQRLILAADSLGASPVQKILYIVLPNSWPGILNGMLLGFARAAGDTMVSLMLTGNSPAPVETITGSARTLTSHIALVLAFDFDSMEFKSVFVCGLVLYLFTALSMIFFRMCAATSSRMRS
ncbi:MAG TPA: ABC transporter permease subunit [Thermodesulfobacteriaceae bacterium]|nr:ABC transporter permease subunit [Thermodesulfobacteriaceae bacterium]